MKAETLQDLFERDLEFAYDGEQRLAEALPKMAEASSSAELKVALEHHLEETRMHVARLEQIFANLNRASATETNHVIHSVIGEGEKLIKHIDRSALLDAALIACGTQVEHYEIALYGALSSFARVLGFGEAAELLAKTLEEEKTADHVLARIAETSVNHEALRVTTVNHEFNFI